MNLFNNPTFWEVLGAILVLIAAVPVVYLFHVAARIGYDAWRGSRRQADLEARIVDPAFGELRRVLHTGWEGEVTFAPTQQRILVSIDAGLAGPTDEQRQLFRQIEGNYERVLPEIHRSLVEYVKRDGSFELCSIDIRAEHPSATWRAQYVTVAEDDADMGYFVDVADWKVADVFAVD